MDLLLAPVFMTAALALVFFMAAPLLALFWILDRLKTRRRKDMLAEFKRSRRCRNN